MRRWRRGGLGGMFRFLLMVGGKGRIREGVGGGMRGERERRLRGRQWREFVGVWGVITCR